MKTFKIELLDDQQTVLYCRVDVYDDYAEAENTAKWYLVATVATAYKITELWDVLFHQHQITGK